MEKEQCRGCLKQKGKMYSLFDEYENDVTLASLLKQYLNKEIYAEDSISTMFCRECALLVIEFYNFSQLLQESEKKLTELQKARVSSTPIPELSHFTDSINEPLIIKQETECIFIKNELETDVKMSDELDASVLESTNNCESQHDSTINKEILLFVGEEFEKVTTYDCDQCNSVFLTEGNLQKHLKVMHNETKMDLEDTTNLEDENSNGSILNSSFQCELCNEAFDCKEKYEDHKKEHDSSKPFICEVCGLRFAKKNYLKQHSDQHTEEKQFQCVYCKKRFQRRSVCLKHVKIHTSPKGQICDKCGKGFTSLSNLKVHIMLKHSSNSNRKYKCNVCDMTFNLKCSLDRHVYRRHNIEKQRNFSCNVCNIKYYDKSSLKRHYELKHSNHKKLHECSECKKAYTTVTNLSKHVQKHHKKT